MQYIYMVIYMVIIDSAENGGLERQKAMWHAVVVSERW